MRSRILVVLAVLAAACLPAAAWGSATHAYVADHFGSREPVFNSHELYGAMLPDLFQSNLALNFDPLADAYTHGRPGAELFMDVWIVAHGTVEKAVAFGYVGHNNVWGEDFHAHDLATGYIIQKATLLDAGLDAAGVWTEVTNQTGLTLSAEDRILYCHIVVEEAGDLIIRRADRAIGAKVAAAAFARTPIVPKMLVAAMRGLDPATVRRQESDFRRSMILYGTMLLQEEPIAKHLLADMVADQALAFLAYKYPGLPTDQLRPFVRDLSLLALQQALPLVEPDYMDAVAATANSVAAALQAHGVDYVHPPLLPVRH